MVGDLKFFDYDNDGDADLILANGHPDDMVEIQSLKVKYKEPLLMFENENGKYKNVSATSEKSLKESGRLADCRLVTMITMEISMC